MKQPRWVWVLAVMLGALIGLLVGSIGSYRPERKPESKPTPAPTYTLEVTEDAWTAFSEWLKKNK